MQAITHQFCTLRNVSLVRAQRANISLGKQIHLSSFHEVNEYLLDRGKLLGNRFEITMRNLKRVQRLLSDGETWKERTIPVLSSHLDEMVKRVQDFGFINFYGEQRVGDAGFTSDVGVRSFDVGLAMLKGDFSLAIKLIMVGRSNQIYSPSKDESNAREVWKHCNGSLEDNARTTLRVFPKNRCTMVRERDLMKGLIRYGGDALAAIRTVPYSARMFWIHAYQVSFPHSSPMI